MNEPFFWIDREGRWFYEGEEITHRRTYLLYSRNLTVDTDGRFLLRLGKEECRVEAEDAPYVVKSLDFFPSCGEAPRSVDLLLNDETRESLRPETLRVGRENVLYCRVRAGAFSARFSRSAYQILFPLFRQDAAGKRFFLLLGGKEYDLLRE
jgi:uncharacterized protein